MSVHHDSVVTGLKFNFLHIGMNYTITIIDDIAQIPEAQWNTLAEGAGPFLQHAFLSALERSARCTNESGWQPCHIVITENSHIVAAIPGYLKTHSYGEYVFDHAWANAYHQHGLDYYPKWISAIPFTPVSGKRLLTTNRVKVSSQLIASITDELTHYCEANYGVTLSSMHWLFNAHTDHSLWKESRHLPRYNVQFQWHNYDYNHFDDFLASLTSRKRKDIKKQRRRHNDKGIHFVHSTGESIDEETLDFFIKCYQATYLKRSGHTGYLNRDFFYRLSKTMADNMLIVTAKEHDEPIACALFFYDETGLYGRYWGALRDIDGLHFACCYFEGIAFAINNSLPLFNPGTQGEHKILRGFEPIYCQSQHRLFEGAFHQAVAQFLQQETQHLADYFNQARNALPFNKEFVPLLKTTSVIHPNDDTHNHNEKNYET